ncbi:GLPGLI family protein [Chryseobacterium sp. POE27]|uniref:GLPGLI family protein n=1 Tax=Chryseobacterium sp. POE27 TaxID=3138177 RepID=UPI00321A9C31
MNKIFLLLITLLSIPFFAQKISFTPSIRVIYDSSLKLGDNFKKEQKFALIGNSQDYYFGAYQNYLNDTGQYESKGIDLRAISDYFQERVIKKGGVTNTFLTVTESKIRYQENVVLKWVLYGDTKVINGVKCQMAATNKFGRRWIAYFSKEYPQSLGPYKFNGLPGLIFELYDTKDDYHFTATKIEKFNDEFNFNLESFKNYTKENYLKASFNLQFTSASLPVLQGEMRKEFDEVMKKKQRRYNNPLELKPFE